MVLDKRMTGGYVLPYNLQRLLLLFANVVYKLFINTTFFGKTKTRVFCLHTICFLVFWRMKREANQMLLTIF